MSWQRILRFAKIRQVPVIITDETGEDPMILLSLDQLEQALDGGIGPDIPPPTPPPRPTTPSFVPEEVLMSDTLPLEDTIAQAQSEPGLDTFSQNDEESGALPSITVMHALEGETRNDQQGTAISEITSSDEDELLAEPMIMTPPTTAPASFPMVTTPLAAGSTTHIEVPLIVQPLPDVPPEEQPTTAPPASMSLEERFFLEY